MNVFASSLKFQATTKLRLWKNRIGSSLKTDAEIAEDRARTFDTIYREAAWGHDDSGRYYSGAGSRGVVADGYIREITPLLRAINTKNGGNLTVVDIGCGDFHVGRGLVKALPGLSYIGCDIAANVVEFNRENYGSELITFSELDIVKARPPEGDVYLLRQVLQHLNNAEIASALLNLTGKFVIVTEGHPLIKKGRPNPDKVTGKDVRFNWWTGIGRSVELNLPPFNRKTEELFRFQNSANETLVSERLWP